MAIFLQRVVVVLLACDQIPLVLRALPVVLVLVDGSVLVVLVLVRIALVRRTRGVEQVEQLRGGRCHGLARQVAKVLVVALALALVATIDAAAIVR